MKNYRKIMEGLTLEELQGWAETVLSLAEPEIQNLTKEELTELMMEDEGEAFGEAWEMEGEDDGDTDDDEDTDEDNESHEDPDEDF